MSRKNLPSEPIPEVYKSINKAETVEEKVIEDNIKQIPKKTLYGSNLKRIKSFKNLRKSYKISNQKQVFITDMKNMLFHLDTNTNKFNLELLVEVCNIANQFFIYGSSENREASKSEAIYELLLPYFQNDITILTSMLESVQGKIIKSTTLRRLYRRLKNYFF